MALTFGAAAGDRVVCGSAAVLDDLNPLTFLAWVFPTSLVHDAFFYTKWPSAIHYLEIFQTAGNIKFFRGRATTALNYITNDTPFATVNKWYLGGVTMDTGAAAGQQCNIYTGDLTTLAAERTYGTATDGAGAITTDAAANFIIGNYPFANSPWNGRMAVAAIFNRVLTLGEIRSWQFNPRMMAGCVGLWHLGFNGTGTQRDHSGNFNAGTVTGATVAPHVPLRAPFGIGRAWRGAFTAPAAGGLSIPAIIAGRLPMFSPFGGGMVGTA